jgi:hypothetical protein
VARQKLQEVGGKKVVPVEEVLRKAYGRACRLHVIQQMIDRIASEDVADDGAVPADLERHVRQMIEGTDKPWDAAVWELAAGRPRAGHGS